MSQLGIPSFHHYRFTALEARDGTVAHAPGYASVEKPCIMIAVHLLLPCCAPTCETCRACRIKDFGLIQYQAGFSKPCRTWIEGLGYDPAPQRQENASMIISFENSPGWLNAWYFVTQEDAASVSKDPVRN